MVDRPTCRLGRTKQAKSAPLATPWPRGPRRWKKCVSHAASFQMWKPSKSDSRHLRETTTVTICPTINNSYLVLIIGDSSCADSQLSRVENSLRTYVRTYVARANIAWACTWPSCVALVKKAEICIDIRRRSVTIREIFREAKILSPLTFQYLEKKKKENMEDWKIAREKMSKIWEKNSPIRMTLKQYPGMN